jgi:hypothetical protein
MLAAVLLNTAAAFLPLDSDLVRSFQTTSAVAQSHLDCGDWLFKHTSSASHKLHLRCARQSKKILALLHSFTLLSHLQEREAQFRSAPVPVFFPTALFFPRKLSPPSAADEPFLS